MKSTVLVPPTPIQSPVPSGVMPPLKASVAPAGSGATPGLFPFKTVRTLFIPAGKTAA